MKKRWKEELNGVDVSRRYGGIQNLPKVLLFLSREELADSQRKYLEKVLASRIDIDFLINECHQRLIGPIALNHLIALGEERFVDRSGAWKEARRAMAAASMPKNSELSAFFELCLSSENSNHLFVKGPSLAAQFYRTPALRISRDIDVLLPEYDISGVVHRAVATGYKISSTAFENVAHRGSEAIDAFISMNDVVPLQSPKGIFFEIHKTLDRNSGLFEAEKLFEEAQTLDFFGRPIKVLPPELLFCYVVYHSTQHTWARLNWFTDVNAILSQKGFDRVLCLRWATSIGLQKIVAACIELEDWCAAGADDPTHLSRPARCVYDLYVDNIKGGLEREKQIILTEYSLGLPRRFLAARRARHKALKLHTKQAFTPTFDLYSKFPLARPFWWIYTAIRPANSAFRFVKSIARRNRAARH